MISSLRGRAAHVETDSLVLEVGGVGLTIAVTPHVAAATDVGDEVSLHTHLIVREDALSLFGFESRDELLVFTQLLSVTGVGPKSALGVLAALSVTQIADAVASDDDAPFRRVSGIGPKTAKLIVVQLAGKIAAPSPSGAGRRDAAPDVAAQVMQALVGLGWNERAAAEAVSAAAEQASPAERAAVPSLLRLTLATLGPARKEHAGG
ncbi:MULTISPECIES: Holliday junction branch migration protein RuvA [unclassified Microbacterium]|uniref:Holliday junction branch migration protein RuvA n=1 Tax=unclassified Microbacterium TaxID=2609290 RepID=UPI00214CC1EA|nr:MULTISPECIES: Holliday junction branch migration protein RuvA [unclassified Microbacterium]MCR2811058.1 Holliday junction branch migration protein RuvA [Microbacterium sp. zg.B185]WIM17690.1 Holliday junction branch migration protein RuvA [Microbacterium sp. zg-B185]